ncbi:MAG: hypothetical protein H6730_20475 [Deltaproteobacteria bacterium]|nr:hypothetical protein [Deltaproteobacteria bacterium]
MVLAFGSVLARFTGAAAPDVSVVAAGEAPEPEMGEAAPDARPVAVVSCRKSVVRPSPV